MDLAEVGERAAGYADIGASGEDAERECATTEDEKHGRGKDEEEEAKRYFFNIYASWSKTVGCGVKLPFDVYAVRRTHDT
jgi:hypothetical protein